MCYPCSFGAADNVSGVRHQVCQLEYADPVPQHLSRSLCRVAEDLDLHCYGGLYTRQSKSCLDQIGELCMHNSLGSNQVWATSDFLLDAELLHAL